MIELHQGWGAEYFVNIGFKRLGHETYCIDYRKHRDAIYAKFLAAPKCDVFFLQRGDNFPLSIIQSIKLPKLFWASELVSRRRDQDRLLMHGDFDHVFLHTSECRKVVIENGWLKPEDCSVLLNGFDETVFMPDWQAIKDIDVLFVGTITERRNKWLNRIQKLYDVEVFSAYGREMAELINRSKIILNIHSEEPLDTETRVFEVLGCGGFLLSEKLSQDNPFSDNELVQFYSFEDCIQKIKFFLLNPQKRKQIAKNGFEAAIKEHTYSSRAKQIADIMYREIEQRKNIGENFNKLKLLRLGLSERMHSKGKTLYNRTRHYYNRLFR